jgi:hypothetical protein
MPDDDTPENENEVASDEDMPPAAVKLEDVVPDNYDEDVAMADAMAASLANEDANWPGYEDTI